MKTLRALLFVAFAAIPAFVLACTAKPHDDHVGSWSPRTNASAINDLIVNTDGGAIGYALTRTDAGAAWTGTTTSYFGTFDLRPEAGTAGQEAYFVDDAGSPIGIPEVYDGTRWRPKLPNGHLGTEPPPLASWTIGLGDGGASDAGTSLIGSQVGSSVVFTTNSTSMPSVMSVTTPSPSVPYTVKICISAMVDASAWGSTAGTNMFAVAQFASATTGWEGWMHFSDSAGNSRVIDSNIQSLTTLTGSGSTLSTSRSTNKPVLGQLACYSIADNATTREFQISVDGTTYNHWFSEASASSGGAKNLVGLWISNVGPFFKTFVIQSLEHTP